MSSWLRNIQGQLSDLANEVLNEANDVLAEATEEVPDPDAEIIVSKKKCAEAEKQLAIETAKVDSLSCEKQQLEQQLYDAHIEMDTIGNKLNSMVKQRDDEIKKLKNQMEQIQESGWNDGPSNNTSDSNHETIISELRQQVEHWKQLAEKEEEDGIKEETITLTELDKRIESLRQQKEHEIQSIVESHAESMVEMREMYEEKLAQMQVLPYNASSSTSNADTLDAVLLEKDDLMGVKSTNGSDGEAERPVVVDLGSHDELVDERIRQMESEFERSRDQQQEKLQIYKGELKNLKVQNQELAAAYTELNTEYEEFKERNTVTERANNDLTRRIDSLKANLIEYEERYELCKKENAETVSQLERLSNEFARLRTGVANVSQRREDCDTMVNEEVDKLRNALDESRTERERLRDDVQKFQVAVGEIDVELEKLREANRQLLAENQALTENLARYDTTMKDIISSSEEDIGKFREQFQEIQENHRQQREAIQHENDALRDETEAIKRQRDIVLEESALLKEVNEKLKQKSATEEAKIELLQQKASILEQVLEEEKAERLREKEEKDEEKKKAEQDLMERMASSVDGDEDALLKENTILKLQLKEALEANTEKTEECDKLHKDARNLEREVDLRQNCVDEMIAQTNTLQMQQESMSSANKTLQTQILANERQIVQLEEKIIEEQLRNEEMEKKVKRLEHVIIGGEGEGDEKMETDENTEEGEGGTDEKMNDIAPMKRYIADLQSKLSEVEEELRELKEQKQDESKEAAEVRQMLERDLFEAEEVDRGLLEGIETRVKEMEQQLEAKVEALEEAKKVKMGLEETVKSLNERIDVLYKDRIAFDALEEQNQLLSDKLDKLKGQKENQSNQTSDQLSELQNSLTQLTEEHEATVQMKVQLEAQLVEARASSEGIDELRAAIQALQLENEQLKTNQSTETVSTEELHAAIQGLQLENEHLKGVAKTQYDENVKYYEQFQAIAQLNQQMKEQIDELIQKDQENEKRGKELQRLREHLMIVEENSTREAVESEQREMELRARVKQLEARGHQVEEGATETNQQFQVQIASLTSQLESCQTTSNNWKGKYENEVKAREQTQEALSSLQNVVRELSVDHERDSAQASHRNLELQTMIGALNDEIAQIREEMDRQSIGRQAAEEESDRRQLQLDSKQKIIEDLEIQIEELRSPKKPTESYRIDDTTLRQLFLSYFVSDATKRPDIALLLANILEYPQEEMDKFKSAVRQSFGQPSGGSSLFWGSSRSSPSPAPSTIADQFIRFLETESESSRTAPHLPLRTQNDPAPRLSMDSSSAGTRSPNSQSNQPPSASSSAAALDSLLR